MWLPLASAGNSGFSGKNIGNVLGQVQCKDGTVKNKIPRAICRMKVWAQCTVYLPQMGHLKQNIWKQGKKKGAQRQPCILPTAQCLWLAISRLHLLQKPLLSLFFLLCSPSFPLLSYSTQISIHKCMKKQGVFWLDQERGCAFLLLFSERIFLW